MDEQLNIGSTGSTDETVEFGPLPLMEIAKDAAKVAPMSFDELVERVCEPVPPRSLINIQKAYDDYAASTGKDPLTFEDKQAAILAHVLRRSRYRWGWRELHPLSFGAGFLLSSLFWTTIGIAVGILSR